MITILGAGESGVGAAILARKLGMEVFVSDRGVISEAHQQTLEENGIGYEMGKHDEAMILQSELVVKSPGIPEKAALVQALRKAGATIISEIEFAARYTDKPILAITGSNGKTTTTTLAHHLLCTAGINAALGGNVGYSFAKLVADDRADCYVLEISSFQLDDIKTFRPNVAILLNITPDHLDRYEYNIANYARAKFRIAENQTKEDYFIYNKNDANILSMMENARLQAQLVPVAENVGDCIELENGQCFDMRQCSLKGRHNRFNAECAIRAALAMGASAAGIQQGLDTFVNVPHRLEMVATVGGVGFINDSKATNVDAVFYALEAMRQPVVWIVGGTDKGNDYSPLAALVQEKVKAIVCLGVDNEKIINYFNNYNVPIKETRGAGDAVDTAFALAKGGDVVLLSPACASFDLFQNYMDRGDQFKRAVSALESEQGKLLTKHDL
jgi:UDP-N-acetylmuramoylalanine--D-glutamate ligase